MTKFSHRNREYSIKIGYLAAIEVFPEQFGISLTKLLVNDEATNDTIRTLMLNDEVVIDMMWYYIKEQSDIIEKTDFLEKLESKEVIEFREAFWQEALNFSGPLKAQVLTQAWTEMRRYLKKATLGELDSESSPEE